MVGAADGYWPVKFKKGESPNSKQLTWPAVSLYFDELLG
jgi:hypothetical protein